MRHLTVLGCYLMEPRMKSNGSYSHAAHAAVASTIMNEAEWWTRRSEHYDNAFRLLFEKTTQLVAAGLTILVAGSAVVFVYDQFNVLFAVPPIVLLLWGIAARMLHEQLFLALYRDYSEERARRLVLPAEAGDFVVWNSYAGPAMRGWPNSYLYASLAFVSLLLMAGSFVATWGRVEDWFWWVAVALTAIGLVGAVISFIVVLRQTGDGWRALDAHFMQRDRATSSAKSTWWRF